MSSTGGPRGDAQVEQRLVDAQLEPAPQQRARPARPARATGSRAIPSPTRCRARSPAGCRSGRSRDRRRRRSRSGPPCAARSPARSRAPATNTAAPSAAAIQNSTCQSLRSVTSALIGSPSAPPTPRVALMNAIAESTRSSCSTSRMIEMPSGTTPTIAPCRVRPTMMPTMPGRQRRDDRPDDHHGHEHEHDAPLAVHVAEAPRDRRDHRGREQRGGHDPGGVLAARVEQLGQLRLDRHHEREHERRAQAGEGQHRHDRALPRHPGEASSFVLVP